MERDDMDGFMLNGSQYSSANFQDAEELRPAAANLDALGGSQDSLQGILQQSLQRHISDLQAPTGSPALTSFGIKNTWRKKLRDTMVRQNETVFAFLFKPITDHPVVGPVEKALRRFAIRQDIEQAALKPLKDMLTDVSGLRVIEQDIEDCLKSKGPSDLPTLKAQVTALLDLYKETGEKLLNCENRLKLATEKMDKVQQRVGMIMELQSNEALPPLLQTLESYLQVAFRDSTIETEYKELLFYYQKHLALREAIQIFKTGSTLPSEPLCAICITEPVGTAIVPCGHTFCVGCARRMMVECGICRGRITNRQKLFFS
jgi:hypothetical protein